jgi:hypothetical protein
MARRDYRAEGIETAKVPVPVAIPDAQPEVYLVTKRYCFTRNHAMVIMPAGKLYYRKTEGALIDAALKIGAPLRPIDTDKLFKCPHCGSHSLLK